MADQHPITPTADLIRKWNEEAATAPMVDQRYIAIQAARWGWEQRGGVNEAELRKARDYELEACCKTLEDIWDDHGLVTLGDVLQALRAARRPKPPSLKQQALDPLGSFEGFTHWKKSTLSAADQVVPEGGVFLSTAGAARIRAELLAIAAELDAANP